MRSRLQCVHQWPLFLWRTLLLCTLATTGAAAERNALLVGVSDYPNLPGRGLQGPKNDVVVMRSVLERRGFKPDRIVTLADNVPQAQDPTRRNILEALDRLVAQSVKGDFVFIYFAGHGSQMPADPGTPEGRAEPDGLHEIFLPRDAGKWNGQVGRVENAIVDFELTRRLDALLAKEVFVWATFDACHAATLTRGGSDEEIRFRQITPRDLGIPEAAMQVARSAQARTRRGAEREESPLGGTSGAGATGRFVAFYAAQTTQDTPEMLMPRDRAAKGRKTMGLFGYTLAEALSTFDGVTYRQVAQHILQRYAAQNFLAPTPLFTGNGLDQPIFGSSGGRVVRQWPLDKSRGLRIEAGMLEAFWRCCQHRPRGTKRRWVTCVLKRLTYSHPA